MDSTYYKKQDCAHKFTSAVDYISGYNSKIDSLSNELKYISLSVNKPLNLEQLLGNTGQTYKTNFLDSITEKVDLLKSFYQPKSYPYLESLKPNIGPVYGTSKLINQYISGSEYVGSETHKVINENRVVHAWDLPDVVRLKDLLGIQVGVPDKTNHAFNYHTFESLLPKHDYTSTISPILELSRGATLNYTALSASVTANELALSVSANYQPWYNETISKYSSLFPYLSRFNPVKSNEYLTGLIGSQDLSAFSVHSVFSKATELSLHAEKSLSAFKWNELGSRIGLNDISRGIISDSFLNLTNDYYGLSRSFNSNPSSFTEINPALIKAVPVEFFSGANILEMISVEEESTPKKKQLIEEIQYENEYSINIFLTKVHPELVNMWKGAIETLKSGRSDSIRHFSVSLRELFTHLLHKLAPDRQIKLWSQEPTYYFDGRPTRKARLLFICRNILNDPFNKLIETDINATLDLMDIFQKGTHSLDINFTTQELEMLKCKAESSIKFLLSIAFGSNN